LRGTVGLLQPTAIDQLNSRTSATSNQRRMSSILNVPLAPANLFESPPFPHGEVMGSLPL
jgi:hypothetical protein